MSLCEHFRKKSKPARVIKHCKQSLFTLPNVQDNYSTIRAMNASFPSAAACEQQDDPTLESETTTSTKSLAFETTITRPRKRVIDETLLSPEEAGKLESRRAYNRDCANRARKRTKNLVAQLQDEVKELQADKDELRRANAVMKAQLEIMGKQHQSLMLKQAVSEHHRAISALGATSGYVLPWMLSGDAPPEFDVVNRRIAANREAASRARGL